MNIYDIEVKDASGKTTTLAKHKDKVLLIVNTASLCGFTPQFEGLEKLYKDYTDKGLEILGFPCNQFGEQDPGSTDYSITFCQKNYGVTFPIYDKIDVNGPDESPLYTYLKKQKGGLLGSKIKWNFTKFLVDKNGNVIKRFGSTTTPAQIERFIAKLV